ncbi:hypothetical protein DPV78_001913 [Talaromyces pinophilus]|nr:hypothetical protein DPV78_001913 [Talaromyces pinophilus]
MAVYFFYASRMDESSIETWSKLGNDRQAAGSGTEPLLRGMTAKPKPDRRDSDVKFVVSWYHIPGRFS